MVSLRQINHALMRSLPASVRNRIVNGSLEYIHETAYEAIKRRGFRPGGIIDIGASSGSWAETIVRYFPCTPILMIESLDEQRQVLEQIAQHVNGSVEIALLGAVDGRSTDFWVMGTGSSVYSETTDVPRALRSLVTRTLDTVMADHKSVAAPLFVKIDAQGSELDILKGATKTLQSIELVQLEVALMEYNAGAPTAYDVFKFMEAAGFSMFEFAGVGRKGGNLVQIDVIFVKTISPLRKTRH